jgi:hypothetical protein
MYILVTQQMRIEMIQYETSKQPRKKSDTEGGCNKIGKRQKIIKSKRQRERKKKK